MALTGVGVRPAQAQRERGFFAAGFTVDGDVEEVKRIHRRTVQQRTREFTDPPLSGEVRASSFSVEGGE